MKEEDDLNVNCNVGQVEWWLKRIRLVGIRRRTTKA
jgi:hypothetical protein